MLAFVGIPGGISAGMNVAIGAVIHPFDKSKDVYLGRAGTRALSPVALSVQPLLAPERRGLAVSLTF